MDELPPAMEESKRMRGRIGLSRRIGRRAATARLLLTTDNSNLWLQMAEALVGAKEVAELLGVSRQRVDMIARTHGEFPKPIGELAAGRIWKRQEIVRWAKRTGRLISSISQNT